MVPYTVSREAAAIVACESGDGYTYGTYSIRARSRTEDGGLYQFNDATYIALTGRDHAETDTVTNQRAAFIALWDGGAGWRHWISSKACWDRWLEIGADDRAVWR